MDSTQSNTENKDHHLHVVSRKGASTVEIQSLRQFRVFSDEMESSSQPHNIQVSQKTATLVIEGGRGHWLTARKDLANAKEKGLLQTYWLDPKRSKTAGSMEEYRMTFVCWMWNILEMALTLSYDLQSLDWKNRTWSENSPVGHLSPVTRSPIPSFDYHQYTDNTGFPVRSLDLQLSHQLPFHL
jgi:hypothetical protein